MIELANRMLEKVRSSKAVSSSSPAGFDDLEPVSILRDPQAPVGAPASLRTVELDEPTQDASEQSRIQRWRSVSFKARLQFMLPLAVAMLLAAMVFLALDSKQSAQQALLSQVLSDALMHSQRLAKATPDFISGSAQGTQQLRESRDALSSAVAALQSASGDAGLLGTELPPAPVQAVVASWDEIQKATQQLVEQARLIQSLGQLTTVLINENRNALEASQVIAAHKVGSGASAREVSAAGDLVMLTQKIPNEAARLSERSNATDASARTLESDLKYFGELLAAFANGSERLRVGALSDPESRQALAELVQFERKIAQQMEQVLAGLPKLVVAKKAEAKVFEQSEVMRASLSTLQQKLRGAESARSTYVMFAAGCGLAALLAALSMIRAYTEDSRKRAEAAERQQQIAQALERDAKRTNDQNQAAILRLMNELQEVADGDLTVQATVSEDITGAIADSVNYTVEELRNLVARINSTAEQVNEASSAAQMTASSLQAASDQQSREIRETGEAVLRMAQQINDVSARASESVHVARQSVKVSQEGGRAVQNAISGMNSIRDQIQDTAKRIKRLGESSQEVGEIVELISDITEQTNVLALNAAIQAASAGEAGRGFTVVAEEVQRLAERSAEATKQISALIKTIQADTQDAVAAMERSTQGVVEGTRLSDDAGRALVDIARVSNQLGEMIESFASNTSRQATSAGGVAQSIQRILLVTEQTSEGTLQTAGSIRQLSELAQELKRSVARFKVT
jgi:twitching motility protein PilJ